MLNKHLLEAVQQIISGEMPEGDSKKDGFIKSFIGREVEVFLRKKHIFYGAKVVATIKRKSKVDTYDLYTLKSEDNNEFQAINFSLIPPSGLPFDRIHKFSFSIGKFVRQPDSALKHIETFDPDPNNVDEKMIQDLIDEVASYVKGAETVNSPTKELAEILR